jgi:hypothetical protein
MRQADHHTPDVQDRTNRKTQVGQRQFTQVLEIEAKVFSWLEAINFLQLFDDPLVRWQLSTVSATTACKCIRKNNDWPKIRLE